MQIHSPLKQGRLAFILVCLSAHAAQADPIPWMSTAPDDVRIPVTAVKIVSSAGTATPYSCIVSTGYDNCYLSLMGKGSTTNFNQMKTAVNNYLGTIPNATVTSVTISSCTLPVTSYTAKVLLTTLLGGNAYITQTTNGFVAKSPATTAATDAYINFNGCDYTINFAGGIVNSAGKEFYDFFDPEDQVWIADGNVSFGTNVAYKAGSCAGTPMNPDLHPFICMAQPRLGLVLDSGPPIRERYRIKSSATLSLFFSSANLPIAGQFRRHYVENTPFTHAFLPETDVPLTNFSANAPPATTYTIATTGGTYPYFKDIAFSRTNPSGQYRDQANNPQSYTGVKLPFSEEGCNGFEYKLPFTHQPYVNTDKFVRMTNLTDDPTLKVSMGPWGTHATPFTGHFFGDPKANWVGFWRFDRLESRRVCTALQQSSPAPGQPKICTVVNTSAGCGVNDLCGVSRPEIDDKIPLYQAYGNQFRIKSVVLKEWNDVSSGRYYYDTPAHFVVEAEVCGKILRFDHVRKISPYLASYMTKLGLDDPTSVTQVTQANAGIQKEFMKDTYDGGALRTIRLAPGEIFAEPQVSAREVSPAGSSYNNTYYAGANGYEYSPWAQMEVFVVDPAAPWIKTPYYKLLSSAAQTSITAIINSEQSVAEITPTFRYEVTSPAWMWKAESGWLVTAEHANDLDLSGVTSTLAGWFEREFTNGCLVDGQGADYYNCVQSNGHEHYSNSMVAIYPINKTSPKYSASNYEPNATVNYLIRKVTRNVAGGWGTGNANNTWLVGEVISPATFGTSGTMLVKWRLEDPVATPPGVYPKYQYVNYKLVPGPSPAPRLKLSWGAMGAKPGSTPPAVLPTSPTPFPANDNVCETDNITCHDHRHNGALGL